ncbi:MAG TPA: ATP-binding SpoIIE family protein phosphatase [Ramlibacter sp.]|nr:ATP-binding SpoIIE family protein phosphatase [Ramlibacter sp.]
METVLSADSRQLAFALAEATQVASTRRAALELAAGAGFSDTTAGQLALLVTEAATNILKHASHGEILLRPTWRGGAAGVEVLALDHGPGMRDLPGSMEDGTSSAGSYGVGLGAIRRLASEFDVYSAPGKGTVLYMVLWAGATPPHGGVEVGLVCQPVAGETECGDCWSTSCAPTQATLLVADGLGHGPLAAQASQAAATVVAREPGLPPAALLDDAHAMLRSTRGAAVSVAQVDMHTDELRYAGVGNVAAHLFNGGERKQLVSHNGIVGSNIRKLQEFVLPWNAGAMLIMHSDGLASRWDLEQYPGLIGCHPALIAAVLYRDYTRGRDDVAVLVARDLREPLQ